jgi:hypothetical protein
MTINKSLNEDPQSSAEARKPYEKPSFRFEQVFVTSALSCGKITNTDQSCNFGQLSAS